MASTIGSSGIAMRPFWANKTQPKKQAHPLTQLSHPDNKTPAPTKKLLGLATSYQIKNDWYKIVMNRYAYATIALNTSSAALHGANSLWIPLAIAALAQSNIALVTIYLACYCGIILLTKGIDAIANPMFIGWRQVAFKKLIEHTDQCNRYKVEIWADNILRKDVNMAVATGQANIDTMIYVLDGATSYGIGIITRMAVLATVVNYMIFPIFVGVVVVLSAYFWATNKTREEQAEAQQEAQMNISKYTNDMADNVMLPNQANYRLYTETWHKKFADLEKANRRASWWKAGNDFTMACIAILPCAGAVVYSASLSLAAAQAAVVSIPTGVDLLTQFTRVMAILGQWSRTKSKIKKTIEQTQPNDVGVWNKRINAVLENKKSIKIIHHDDTQKDYTVDEINQDPEILLTPGHWSISADNGTGKSSLMLATVNYFKNRINVAYWHPDNTFAMKHTNGGSSGQRALAQLEELGADPNIELLCIDESNGFLDEKNKQKLKKQIKQWSQKRPVIEICQTQQQKQS